MNGIATGIGERIAEVRRRIATATGRTGRDASSVAIIAVTKGHSIEVVRAAATTDVSGLGENRVGELAARASLLPGLPWHMVGRLQSNKVRSLPGNLHAIHSVDRPSLVSALAKRYGHSVAAPALYVEVNVAGEQAKGGVEPKRLDDLMALMDGAGLTVIGLMTVAPRDVATDEVRAVFRVLAAMAYDRNLHQLSMGMSDDYEVAVEEGATVIRLGRVLFGQRPVSATGPV